MLLVLPDEEMQIIIRNALKEDINTRNRDLETIKTWLLQQPHLPDSWDDDCIMNFLRGCSFSLEKCKRKLDMYFTMRAMVPELFTNRDISRPELEAILKIANLAVLPGLTADGKRVSICAAVTRSFDFNHDFGNFFKAVLMIGDIRLKTEKYGVSGDVYILDADVDLKSHFLNISLFTLKKFFLCIQEAYPVKIKEVHIVNINPFVDFIFTAVKPFMKEKLRQRIFLHSKIETLHEYVPKSILPEEYGGTAGKLEVFKAKWHEKLKEFTPWFKMQEDIKADEAKRPGKATTYEDLFGLDGSFRKLTID